MDLPMEFDDSAKTEDTDVMDYQTPSRMTYHRPPPSLGDRISRLPQELIDMIHVEYARPIDLDEFLKNTQVIPTHAMIRVDSSYRVPPILQVNRELRKKYRERYYTLNDFNLPDPATYRKWISSVFQPTGTIDDTTVCRSTSGERGVYVQFTIMGGREDSRWCLKRWKWSQGKHRVRIQLQEVEDSYQNALAVLGNQIKPYQYGNNRGCLASPSFRLSRCA